MNKRLSQAEIKEQQHFDIYSKKYDSNYHYDDPFTKYKISKKTLEFVRFLEKKYGDKKFKILEIGCGTGEYTRHFARLLPNATITGLDISPKILTVAKEKCKQLVNVKFVSRSAYDTKFKKEDFDVVCGFYILHHLDTEKTSSEIKRVIKPGGLVFFYEPNILNPIVYIIKSNKYIKKIVGDSEGEWAINPLNIDDKFKGFKLLNTTTSEYIVPIKSLPIKVLVLLDKISNWLSHFPLIKHFGGSVKLIMESK